MDNNNEAFISSKVGSEMQQFVGVAQTFGKWKGGALRLGKMLYNASLFCVIVTAWTDERFRHCR